MKSTKTKSGFTLAEALATLVIIGVIASLTIPALNNTTNDKQYFAQYKKAVAVFSQTIDRMNAENTYKRNNIDKSFIKENHNAPLYFPKEHPLVEKLQKVFKEITKRDDKPVALGGGTYAKLMPNTVAFGPNFKEFRGNPHGFDEKMDIDMLKQGMLMYALGVLELA